MKFLLCFVFFTSVSLAGSLELMVYNVENLFDTIHDEGKNDWTYLPNSTKGKKSACAKMRSTYRRQECQQTDWTSLKLGLKLSQIKEVVLSQGSKRPAILGLVEVENERVVRKLAALLGYSHFIVSNSPGRRGIDLAILYDESKSLKYISKREHKIVGGYFKKRPTRNILEAKFMVANRPLYVFINHWPSLGNPDHARVKAAIVLKDRILEIKKNDPQYHVIAMGDFNTIPKLRKRSKLHPFRDVFLKDGLMNDLFVSFKKSSKVDKVLKKRQPPGSYYYKKGRAWNHLDRVFLSDTLFNGTGLEVELSSFNIYSPEFIKVEVHSQSIPLRYNHKASSKKMAGYSDHFPLTFNLKF